LIKNFYLLWDSQSKIITRGNVQSLNSFKLKKCVIFAFWQTFQICWEPYGEKWLLEPAEDVSTTGFSADLGFHTP